MSPMASRAYSLYHYTVSCHGADEMLWKGGKAVGWLVGSKASRPCFGICYVCALRKPDVRVTPGGMSSLYLHPPRPPLDADSPRPGFFSPSAIRRGGATQRGSGIGRLRSLRRSVVALGEPPRPPHAPPPNLARRQTADSRASGGPSCPDQAAWPGLSSAACKTTRCLHATNTAACPSACSLLRIPPPPRRPPDARDENGRNKRSEATGPSGQSGAAGRSRSGAPTPATRQRVTYRKHRVRLGSHARSLSTYPGRRGADRCRSPRDNGHGGKRSLGRRPSPGYQRIG